MYNIQDKVFDITLYVTWVLYFAVALGLSTNAPQYLNALNSYVKIVKKSRS
jgi:hypothetical protein